MSEKDTQEKLLGLLKYMVQDHNRYFDKSTAEYLLNRISVETLLESERVVSLKNFVVKSNFFGHVLIKNSYNIGDNDQVPINEWRELLSQKNTKIAEYPEVSFVPINSKGQTPKHKDHLEINSNFSTYYAVRHFNDWNKKKNHEFLGHNLGKINSTIFTLESLCEEQDSQYYPGQKKSTIDTSNEIIEHILKGKDEILKSNWHDEKSFTNRLFLSKRMQLVMKDIEPETLEKLFTTESLGTIIKQSNSHENIRSNPALLGNLLALAPAESWMDGWKKVLKSKHINLVDLFNNKFHGAYGVNIATAQKPGTKKEKTYGSTNVSLALNDEMEFFLPAIAKMSPEKEQLCYLFNGIMKSGDVKLMSLYLDYFDIPHMIEQENPERYKTYERMMNKFNKEDNIFYELKNSSTGELEKKSANSWKEVYSEIKADKLDNSLSKKENIPTKRTLKI